jgi:hypothetical protein
MALGLAEGAMNGMNTVYGNTDFLGILLAFSAFGDAQRCSWQRHRQGLVVLSWRSNMASMCIERHR